MHFHLGAGKSEKLRANPIRGIGFEEAQEIFSRPYYLNLSTDWPEQYRAIPWVGQHLYSLIFEVREDQDGKLYDLVTLWKSTREERKLYAEST